MSKKDVLYELPDIRIRHTASVLPPSPDVPKSMQQTNPLSILGHGRHVPRLGVRLDKLCSML